MDDLGNPTKNVNDTSRAHQDALHFQLSKRLSFGYDKCEILTIGKDKLSSLPVLDLDNKAIKIMDCVKYLRDSFNSKGNNSNLIEKRIQDAIVIIPDILAMTKEITKGNYEIKCVLQLYDSVLMNKLLFNCQARSRLTDQDLKGLEKIQLQTLKQIMGVPYSTSNVWNSVSFP